MKVLTLFLLTCALQHQATSSKILVITSMPAHSHFTLAFRLAKELADRDHQVTFINPYPQKTPIKNLKEIPLDETVKYVAELKKTFIKLASLGPVGNRLLDVSLGAGLTEHAFNNSGVQKLLNSGESFDVVILEHFLNEALVGIAHHFKAPAIFLAPVASCFRNNYLFGNPGPSSYVPDLMGSYTKHMDFWQRLENFLTSNFNDVMRELFVMPVQRQLFKKYVQTDLELDDVLYNISLILATSHPSVNDAVPHLPNVVEIGGYHVSPPKKLPEDVQKFLDEAEEGVVLFSMGSNLKSKDLTLATRKALLKAFAKIEAKVLWKFEEDLPEAPKNVKIMKWLPQQDVLGHPNVKAFITHAGLLSVIETVYYGVPIIGIPIFGDQFNNIVSAVSNGYGISAPLETLTEESFSDALDQILNNEKYRKNAQQRSKVMHDQPLKPIDSAVYWVEHVIRHKGAPHLRSAGSDLKWYQREMVDIVVFLGIVLLSVLAAMFYVTRILLRKIFGSTKKSVTTNKKNK